MLMDHNIQIFNDLEQTLQTTNCCCVVMGTGCGKTYVASEYLNKYNLKALVVSPRNTINESWVKHTNKVDTITYQKLANIYKDINFKTYDIIICDEVHHIGAPKWGEPIKYLIDNNIKVIGLTESSIRYSDGGKDVADEYFNGNVIYGENVASAIEKNILNPVTYVGAMYNSDGLKKTLRGKIQSRLYAKLNLTLNKTPTIQEIIKKNMLPGKRKGIIFASTIEDIKSAIEFVKSVYPDTTIKFVHSKQPESHNEEAFEWFRNTDEGYICSVDMISEGVHIKGVNTLIMLRRTESVNLFNQQLGRCLDASSKEPAILFDLVNNKYSLRIINNRLRVKTNSMFGYGKLNIIPSEQLIVKDYTKDIVDVLEEIQQSLNNNWTLEEDQLLINFYKAHPTGRGLKEFVKQNLSHRTFDAARARAKCLNLTMCTFYTPEEDEIIKQYYPIEGIKCLSRLPGRTKGSLYDRVLTLGVNYNSIKYTPEEDAIIKQYYILEGRNIMKRLPNRVWKNIKQRAHRLGIKSNYFNNWSDKEISLLKQYYKTNLLSQILPNKTQSAIAKKISQLGLLTNAKVICIETGKVYNNIYQTVSNPKNISVILKHLRGDRPDAYGYHWRWYDEI